MSSLRRDIVSIVGCTAIIVIAFALLSYGRAHEVSSILAFGRVLDAIVTAGITGNLIVFLLVKITKWHSLRIALRTFVVVHALPVFVLAVIGPQIEAQFRLGPIMLAYILSFFFWFGLHWAWHLTNHQLAKS